jgi:hypothetical protein
VFTERTNLHSNSVGEREHEHVGAAVGHTGRRN